MPPRDRCKEGRASRREGKKARAHLGWLISSRDDIPELDSYPQGDCTDAEDENNIRVFRDSLGDKEDLADEQQHRGKHPGEGGMKDRAEGEMGRCGEREDSWSREGWVASAEEKEECMRSELLACESSSMVEGEQRRRREGSGTTELTPVGWQGEGRKSRGRFVTTF